MNKKLLAAAVAAAVVASPAAFAESTVYGKMHASIDAQDFDTGDQDNYEVNSRSSRLGFKGSEDLGNGLKAIYQIELGIDINSSGEDGQGPGDDQDGIFGSQTRNTFVGLSGDWGTALVGRHDTPAKIAWGATGVERMGDTVLDLNTGNNLKGTGGGPIGVFHEYRADDAIAYVSPNFSGFTVVAAIMPGEDGGSTSTETERFYDTLNTAGTLLTTRSVTTVCDNGRDGLADHYSVGLMYKGNGLKAGAGYAKYDLDDGCTVTTTIGAGTPSVVKLERDDYEVMQIGASYTMNNFSVGAQYEDTDNWGGIKDTDYSAWAVTGKYTFGNNAINAVYSDSEREPDSPNSDVDKSGWGVGVEHNFSKRTQIYAAYASGETEYDDSSKSDEDNDVFSLGMIHNF